MSRFQAIRLDFCAANTCVSVRGRAKCCIGPSDKHYMVTNLVVDKDDDGEGYGRDPPLKCQRVHPESLVHARRVGEEGGQGGLEEESKVKEGVVHSLLEHRVAPRLADDEIGPLHDHDGDEECRVARVLQDLAVSAVPRLGQLILEHIGVF